jgi:hypothetical protein
MRLLPLALLFATIGFGQTVAFGVKGGVPFKDSFDASGIWAGASSHWIAGPTVELRLPFGLGAEFDALYRKVAYTSTLPNGSKPEVTASQWQFPLLGKFRLPGLILHPFIDGGVVFNKLSYQGGLGPTTGFAAGFGGELKFGKLRVGPELRYTRWGAGKTIDLQGLLQSSQNQVDLLVGITWGK